MLNFHLGSSKLALQLFYGAGAFTEIIDNVYVRKRWLSLHQFETSSTRATLLTACRALRRRDIKRTSSIAAAAEAVKI